MSHPDDNDLRDLFARSRTEDRQQAGDFDTLLASRASRPSPARPHSRRMVTMLAAASLVAAVAYGAFRDRPPVTGSASLSFDPHSTSWESPTDFLLATPGNALLRTMPTLHYTAPGMLEDSSLTPQPAGASPARRTTS